MKTSLVIVSLLFLNIFGYSQNVRKFFVPTGDLNRDFMFGTSMPSKRIYFYDSPDSSSVQINLLRSFQDRLANNSTFLYVFVNNEVRCYHSKISSILVQSEQNHIPAIVELKVPPKGSTVSWEYYLENEKYRKTASWTLVTVNSIKKKAIRVVEVCLNCDIEAKKADYFVEDLGYWKTEIFSGSAQIWKTQEIMQ